MRPRYPVVEERPKVPDQKSLRPGRGWVSKQEALSSVTSAAVYHPSDKLGIDCSNGSQVCFVYTALKVLHDTE
jgi:hypothetical protein